MATYRDTGIVLRTKAVRETDRHYSVFTKTHGKVVLLAKGTRKTKSKMSPHMASVGVVDIMVAKGKVMDRLAGADLVRSYRRIPASLERTAHAQGLLLAVDALTRRELPEPRIFDLAVSYLDALDDERWSAPSGRSLLFDAAAVKLLAVLGFGLELEACVGCRTPLVPEGNALNILRGGMECSSCRRPVSVPVGDGTIKTLRLFGSEPFATVAKLALDEATRRQVVFVVDLLLTTQLESAFGALRYLRSVA